MNQSRRRSGLRAWLALCTTAYATTLGTTSHAAPSKLQLSFTNSSSLILNADNRNTASTDLASRVDDNWGLWYNRLNAQVRYGNWFGEIRLDGTLYPFSPSPTGSSFDALEVRRADQGRSAAPFNGDDADFFIDRLNQAQRELEGRYTNWLYPAKYRLRYKLQNVEFQLGDFYGQFGRGLVLSVRKRDELTGDTTLRGGRVDGRFKFDSVRLKLTALGGTANPLRVDQTSGRNLGSGETGGLSSITEFLMPTVSPTDLNANPPPNYLTDTLFGGAIEAKIPGWKFSLHGIQLLRDCLVSPTGCRTLSPDPVRDARTITNAGASLEASQLAPGLAVYVEGALQTLSDRALVDENVNGGALYTSITWGFQPIVLSFEGKHYRQFFPLSGNVDLVRAREFSAVQYNTPPTTEALWIDTAFENFNSCVTGGRLKADIALPWDLQAFGWAGRYATTGELGDPTRCGEEEGTRNDVWDLASGVEWTASDGSHGNALFGLRFDDANSPLFDAAGRETFVFYREQYIRYDIVQQLTGTHSLQVQGWNRRRRQTIGGPADPWLQGTIVAAYSPNSDWTFAAGFEYDQHPAFPDTYVNGQISYRFLGSQQLSLFVGQRQGGIRCVAGVCRTFAPFEGARLDATVRF